VAAARDRRACRVSGRFADHFSTVADGYAAYRPTYPPALFDRLADLAPGRALAWDCATGSGQAAVPLADRFERVVATDASADQIARARPRAGVEYRVATADDSGLPDASADLVTVAQALHWLDASRFYAEAARVLRPGGVLAAWCYQLPRLPGPSDPILVAFALERVGRHWQPERRHVEAGYRDLDFPFEELAMGDWRIAAQLTRDAFLGYVRTWSAVVAARRAEGADPVVELERSLDALWPAGEVREVQWPMAIRAGRVPSLR
jgi:SAM-dependent methyltransferase